MKIKHLSRTTLASAALLVAALAPGAAGCGHSEEEWQAMLARQREIEARCQPGAAGAPAPADLSARPGAQGCARDLDCKGDRICDLGRCAPPR